MSRGICANVRHTAPSAARFATLEAVEFAKPTHPTSGPLASLEKHFQCCAVDKEWSPGVDRRQPLLQPISNSVFVDVEEFCDVADVVGAACLDPRNRVTETPRLGSGHCRHGTVLNGDDVRRYARKSTYQSRLRPMRRTGRRSKQAAGSGLPEHRRKVCFGSFRSG